MGSKRLQTRSFRGLRPLDPTRSGELGYFATLTRVFLPDSICLKLAALNILTNQYTHVHIYIYTQIPEHPPPPYQTHTLDCPDEMYRKALSLLKRVKKKRADVGLRRITFWDYPNRILGEEEVVHDNKACVSPRHVAIVRFKYRDLNLTSCRGETKMLTNNRDSERDSKLTISAIF